MFLILTACLSKPFCTFLQAFFRCVHLKQWSPFCEDHFAFVDASGLQNILCNGAEWCCGNMVMKDSLSNVMDLLNLLRAPC